MSYITRTGNLTEAPTLRTGESGPYTYARVAVSDRIRQEDGSYVDGPAVFYDVAVGGSQATNLVEAAEPLGREEVPVVVRRQLGVERVHHRRAPRVGQAGDGDDIIQVVVHDG